MIEKGKTIGPENAPRSKKLYLQPLAVALVCSVFIALVLIMGLLNMRTLDNTLDRFMQERGLNIIKSVHKTTENYFQRLIYAQQSVFDTRAESLSLEDSFDLQETLISDFVGLTQELDLELKKNRSNQDKISMLSAQENLWLIALLDNQGNILFKSRPVPEKLLKLSDPVARGTENIKMKIFSPSGAEEWTSFITLPRESGRGVILLALDEQGFRYRCLKVSLQRAIQEVVPDSGISYFRVTDSQNRPLGSVTGFPLLQGEPLTFENNLTAKKTVITRKRVLNGQNFFEIVVPIFLLDAYPVTIRLLQVSDSAEKILGENKKYIFISMSLMILIASLSMWLLYKNQNKHLARIQKMESRVRQAEKLSALGRLGAGVAHEIRNPLNAISMATQRLKIENFDKITGVIRDEIRRLDHILVDFLNLAKTRELEPNYHDLTAGLKQIVILMEEEAASRGITIKTHWPPAPVRAFIDLDKIKQVFLNIIKNAMESVTAGGSIHIFVVQKHPEWLSIKISDTGTGLSAEEIEHIFDPDYTTKERGLGLGLTIAHEIIQGHGGEIHVSSQENEGTVFEILLPEKIP